MAIISNFTLHDMLNSLYEIRWLSSRKLVFQLIFQGIGGQEFLHLHLFRFPPLYSPFVIADMFYFQIQC